MFAALTEIPRQVLSQIPSNIPSMLAGVGPARLPAPSSQWQSVANNVATSWIDGAGGAAGASLTAAATSAAGLEKHASTINQAVTEGGSFIGAALIDLGRIAIEFMQKAASALLSSLSGGPAGIISGFAQVTAHGQTALAEAMARLQQLAGELAGPASQLASVIAAEVGIPAAPQSAGSVPQAGSALTPGTPSGSPSGLQLVNDTASASDGGFETAAMTTPAAGGAGAPTPQAQAAVDKALSAVGTPYQWGGNTPGQGLDCSGLTKWAYGEAGVDIPRTADAQAVGTQVSQDQVLPGDLVVWDGHVAMAIGNGQMVEAGDPVQVNPIRTTNMGMGFKGFYRPTA